MPATGPHLAIAVLCEKVITEGDGVMSIIRVIDRVIQTATGAEPPEDMPPFLVENIQMVIALKSDQARGRYMIKIIIEDPHVGRVQVGEQDVNLKPGNQGINLVVGMRLELAYEGIYWMDVMFGKPKVQEDVLLTRIPLEVVYERQRVSLPPPPAES